MSTDDPATALHNALGHNALGHNALGRSAIARFG